MKVESDKMDQLVGQKGLIYLLMIDREVTGKQLAEDLAGSDLIQDAEPRIYAIISELEKNGFVEIVRREGKEKIRSANKDALLQLYSSLGTLHLDEDIISIISRYMKYFIKYLEISFQRLNVSSWRVFNIQLLFEKYISFQRSLMSIALWNDLSSLGVDNPGVLKMLAPLFARLFSMNQELFESETEMMEEINNIMTDEEREKLKEHYLNYVLTPEIRESWSKIIELLK